MPAAFLIFVFTLLHTALPSVAAAQSERKPQIDITAVQSALLTQSGATAGETEVTYRIEFVPRNATRAEIQVLRDEAVVRSFPAPMKAGINTVTLPSGIQMENPIDYLAAQVTLPGGKLSESSVVSIYDREQFERRDRGAKARFDRVVPDVLIQRRGTQVMKLFGSDLAAVSDRIIVNGIDVKGRLAGGVLELQIPPDVFRLPGFATIEPRGDFMNTPVSRNQRLSIAIADPALPVVGGLQSPRIDAVEYQGNQYSDRLVIRGFGFRRNQKVVIGRGRTPIEARDAEMQDQKVISTYMSGGPPADDYFVAVLSADGRSMTRPFPIPSPDKMRAAAALKPVETPDEPTLIAPGFRVFGDLAWNVDKPQFLFLEGPIAKPGLRVSLKREGQPIIVEATADGSADSGRKYPVVRIPVPPELTHKARFNVQVVIHTK